jgi:hypothetical protein
MTIHERERRWRLVLGGGDADGLQVKLQGGDSAVDAALGALYDGTLVHGSSGPGQGQDRRGGLGKSAPSVARWLGDIRTYFPGSVVRVLQKDAVERLNLRHLLLEPELLNAMEPDIHLVTTLLALKNVIPDKSKETARRVVQNVVDDLIRNLTQHTRQTITGSLNRANRTRNPRFRDIDWHRTIRANLQHYQPDYQTIVPVNRIGLSRKRTALRDIVLCVDESGSMATSVVYASVFAAVLATLPSVTTRMVVFDTAVVDLTPLLVDPVDVLFGTQLGGGTDIARALRYCETLVRRPEETILILISDLYEGGNVQELYDRVSKLVAAGVQVIALLALSDDGAPAYDHRNAEFFASLGIPTFACTPDRFPDLMAVAIERRDVAAWVAATP